MQTKRENRGGVRQGAGRPTKQPLSQNQLIKLMATANAYAKKHGKTVEEILLDMIYGFSTDDRFGDKDRLSAIKMFMDRTYINISEGGEADKALSEPSVYLPERRPDPNNIVEIKSA